MKIKSILLAALAVTALASCSKDGDNGGKKNTEPVDVFMRMSHGTETRADSEGVANNTPVTFSEGYIFFTDGPTSAANILRAVRITTSSIAGTVTPGELEAGKVIHSVHQDATHVWVFGNIPAKDAVGATIPDLSTAATTIAGIEAIMLDIITQGGALYDNDPADGSKNLGIESATLYGKGEIDFTDSGTNFDGEDYDAAARFDVAPIISRLEINKVQANNTGAAPADIIDGYTLKGIYINEFYFAVGVNAGTSAATLLNYGQDVPSYDKYDAVTAPNAKYLPAWEHYLFNQMNLVADDGGTPGAYPLVTPTNAAWAYNVFATMAVPHIVFHFEDMKVGGADRPNTVTGVDGQCYLTVTGYTHVNGGGQVAMTGGRVYKLSNVFFQAGDLGNTPEPNDKFSCLVEINLLPWKVDEVDPIFN